MKISTFIIFLTTLQICANTYSQSFNVKIKNGSLSDVFQTIEMQTDYTIFYKDNHVNSDIPVNINIKDCNIEKVLDLALDGTNIKYSIIDNIIVLLPKEIPSQEITVKGRIEDIKGIPLPGVNIVEKGTTNGTVSNLDGEYTLEISSPNAILRFSFVGYLTEDIAVNGQTLVNLTMIEDIKTLEEVVVVGYGTQRRVNLTGAISTVTSETLENRPISSTAQGLQGVIPNLNINFTNGDPSDRSATDYNIRGYESINGGSPYILVDGVPMDLEDINPNDIESISVLKDASASAIYGGKAAFGVILVTTKNVKRKDKITVKYSNETALSRPIMKGFDPVDNSYDYASYKNLMYTNDGSAQLYDDQRVAGIKAYYDNPGSSPEYAIVDNNFEFYGYNNYEDILIRDFTPSYKHNLTVTGGTEKTSFFASVGNFKKEGIFKYGTDIYTRNNILIKTNQDVASWLSFDQKIALNQVITDKSHDYGVNAISAAAAHLYDPLRPIKFPKNDPILPELGGMYFDNVVGYLDEGGRTKSKAYDTWLTAGLNFKPINRLNIRSEISYNYNSSSVDDAVTSIEFVKTEGVTLENPLTYGYTSPTSASLTMRLSQGYIFNTYAEYEIKELGAHYIKAMIGFNQEYRKWDKIGGTGLGLITNQIPHIGATLGEKTVGGSSDVYTLRGAFYRLNYIYSDKYLIEFSGRYDGTSRFPEEDRYGFFPSGSIGWRVSEESFMEQLDFIDNLKLRLSYGELGNQSISYDGSQQYHPYLSTLGVSTAHYLVLDYSSGSLPEYTTIPLLVSNSLTWETVATKDIGVDFTILGQKLDGSFDYYIRETQDMLLKRSYPETLSAIPPWENGADLETKGWEFTLHWRDNITQDLSYGLRFSMWDFKSTITKFYNPTKSFSNYYEGQEIGEIWGYETVGLFKSQDEIDNGPNQSNLGTGWQPGDVWYKDQLSEDTNGDGVPDQADGVINTGESSLEDHGDLVKIGNRTPRYSYSFSIDLDYKNFGFTAFFQGVGKKDYYPNANFSGWWPWAVNGTIKQSDIDDSWTQDNDGAYWYRATADARKNISTQTRWLQDASYLRLKSVVLNYTLPFNLISRIGLTKADVFISGQNLWEISNFIYDRDPEQNIGNYLDPFQHESGPNHISYPSQRTFSAGVNLTF